MGRPGTALPLYPDQTFNMKDITKTEYWRTIEWALNYNPTREEYYIHVTFMKSLYTIGNGVIYLPFYYSGEQIWRKDKPIVPNNTWERNK